MSSINILHLLNGFGDSSISRIVQRLVLNLDHHHFNWHIGGLNELGIMQGEFRETGAQVVDFSEAQHQKMGSWRRIREYIIANRINIVHTHTPRTLILTWLAMNGLPIVPQGRVYHVNTKHLLTTPKDRSWGLIYTLLDRFSLYLPNRTVAVSKAIYQQIVSQAFINKSHVTMIHNAIPTEHFFAPEQRNSFRSGLGLTPESFIIGYAGRIQKVKRIDLLLSAFSSVLVRFPQSRLIIVGDGDLRPQMEDYAVKLGISNAVFWLGFSHEIPRFLAALDIYIQSSVNEGLPLSVLEAMAAGKPVIATNVGGINEVITNEKTGLLIPPESSSAIISAIIYLLENPDIRHRIGQAARSHVIDDFNIQPMVNAYRSVYENCD